MSRVGSTAPRRRVRGNSSASATDRAFGEAIRPTLELSDLVKAVDGSRGALSKYKDIVQKIHLDSVNEAIDRLQDGVRSPALKRLADQVNSQAEYVNGLVASFRRRGQTQTGSMVDSLEQATQKAREALSAFEAQYAALKGATKFDRVAASTSLPDVDPKSASSSPTHSLPIDGKPAITAIASARDLGMLVREAREERGLSQQAFADLAGVGRRFISELENGKPTIELEKALQVAMATGIVVLARHRR